jgi:hypothetical protein
MSILREAGTAATPTAALAITALLSHAGMLDLPMIDTAMVEASVASVDGKTLLQSAGVAAEAIGGAGSGAMMLRRGGVGDRGNPKLVRVAFACCRAIQQLFGDTCSVEGRALILRQVSKAFVEDTPKQLQIFSPINGTVIVHHRSPIKRPLDPAKAQHSPSSKKADSGKVISEP